MKYFKNIKESNNVLTFDLESNKKINKGLSNAIRRLIISKIPVIAIDSSNITYQKNTSVLHNEILSNRLELIPWNYNAMKKLDLSTLEVRFQAENQAEEIDDVLVEKFQLWQGEKKLDINQYTDFGKILFLKLKPFQEIEFIAKFKEATQRDANAAFCPTSVSICTFKIDDKALQKALKEVPKEFQRDFEIENKEKFYLQENSEPTVFQFMIESIGQRNNKDIFKVSLDILINEIDKLVKGLMENIDDIISIQLPKISMTAFDFVIPNEDDTLGNLIQSYILLDDKVAYAGYDVVHPLQKTCIVRIALKENNTLDNNRKVFLSTLTEIKKLIMELKKEFK